MKKAAWTGGIFITVLLGLFLGRNYLGITDIPASELKAKYGQDSRYIEVLGTEVRIKESGQGEPLLLLHGFAASADTWDGWRGYLDKHYRVIAVDVPPFGITGPLTGRHMSPAELQNFMDALVAKLGLTQFYLGGNSLGGYISWNYARRHPDQVKKLILVDSAGYPQQAPLPVKLMKTPVVRDITAHFSPYFVVAASVRDVYGSRDKVTDAQIQRYHDMMRRDDSRPAVAELMSSLNVDGQGIKDVKTPTLIIWGGRDRWIPPAHAELFHRDISGSQLTMFDELGHIPMEEDPARTSLVAARFLQSEPVSK